MKLKPIVASLIALGVSGSLAIAGTEDLTGANAYGSRCKVMSVMDQNQGQAFSFDQLPMNGDWSNRLTVSGLANIDAVWMDRVPTAASRYQSATKRSHTDITLANANLYFDSKINCWTNVHVGTTYKGQSLRHHDQPFVQGIIGGIANNANTGTASNFDVDEAFVTIMDSARSPYYFKAGKQYVQFGNHERFPITASLTQLLSTTRADAAVDVGFVDTTGWNGGLYVFNGLPGLSSAAAANSRINNGGVHLGYAGEYNTAGYNIDVDYLSNMNDVAYLIGTRANYLTRVGGWSFHGDLQNGPFDFSADWVRAARTFHATDYVRAAGTLGARPSAFGVDAGYTFCTSGLPSRVGLGYQASRDGSRLGAQTTVEDGLPRTRWVAQYGVEVGRYVDVAVQYVTDRDYTVANGGEADRRNAGVLRLGVRFA